MSTEKELQTLLNIPITITLSGKEFKVSTPTIKDLSEAQQVTKELKKKHRKEALQERLALMQEIEKTQNTMNAHEKKELLDSYLPRELSAQERMEIYNNFPANLSENDKNIRMATVLAERNEADWTETLHILWKGIKKNHPEITFSDIEGLVTIKDLKEVIKVLNPSDEAEKIVEGVSKK